MSPRANTHNSISNTITHSSVTSIVPSPLLVLKWALSHHCHHLCLHVHFAPYPLLLIFKILHCDAKDDDNRHHLPFRVALVQKTMTSSYTTCCRLLCVVKRVLIYNTLIVLTLNLLNFFVGFFLDSIPNLDHALQKVPLPMQNEHGNEIEENEWVLKVTWGD